MRRAAILGAFALLVACGSQGQDASMDGGTPPPAGDALGTMPSSDGSSTSGSDALSNPQQDAGTPPASDGGSPPPPPTGGLGPAQFAPGELDTPSHGGTITFQQIGAAGWYPSRRDPAAGPCDARNTNGCCLTKYQITSDALTPWNEELVMTLRGPMLVKQLAVYQPSTTDAASDWQLVSGWDAAQTTNIAFKPETSKSPATLASGVGSECLVDVYSGRPFPCGAGSVPFCPSSQSSNWGWAGSKLFVLLTAMPHAGKSTAPGACSTGTTGGWYDAPWVGLAVGELPRAGSFASCQCFAKDPTKWYLADGCGQFNVFEVVNDNNAYTNLDVFSTDLIDYSGYVGQGPCGSKCNVSALAPEVDLIDKTSDREATQGAVATPKGGPSAALRRPGNGYRYLIIALDVGTRTVQLGVVHPQNIPPAIAGLLPNLPATIARATVDGVLGLRLPK
jgi:hypothetical protein